MTVQRSPCGSGTGGSGRSTGERLLARPSTSIRATGSASGFSIQQVGMRVRALPAPLVGVGAGLLILVVDAMRPEGVAPFIYYQF